SRWRPATPPGRPWSRSCPSRRRPPPAAEPAGRRSPRPARWWAAAARVPGPARTGRTAGPRCTCGGAARVRAPRWRTWSRLHHLPALAGDRAGGPDRADPAAVVANRGERGRGHHLTGPAYQGRGPGRVLDLGQRRLLLHPG